MAHDIANPLATVLANLEFLCDLVEKISPRSEGVQLSSSDTKRWLADHLGDVDVSLRDARSAAERIRSVVQHLRTLTPAERQLMPTTRPPPAAAKAELSAPMRVLVVDDEESIGTAIRRALKDHDIRYTPRPDQALEWLESGERFDVVICDIMMPRMSGAELREAVERFAPDQAADFIFVTGGVPAPEVKALLDARRAMVIEKPFDMSALREVLIAHVVSRPRRAP